jgi:prophage regulatory protein
MSDKFITMSEVRERTSLSKTEIYRRIAAGTFPHSIPLGRWRIVFRDSDIAAWMDAQAEAAALGGGRRERESRAREAVKARWA